MTTSLNRRRFWALGLGFACLAIQISCFALLSYFHRAHQLSPFGDNAGMLFVAVIVPIGFSVAAAALAKNYDQAAFITAAVPAMALFLVFYASGVHEFGSRDPGTLYNTIGGPAAPLDVIGQAWQLFCAVAWAALVTLIAIVLKRGGFFMFGLNGKADPEEIASDNPLVFNFTCMAILAACAIGMLGYAGYVAFQNTDFQRVIRSARILDSPTSTKAEVRWAMRQLHRYRYPESDETLTRVADEKPAPLSTFAACVLAERGDISRLTMAEAALMQPSALPRDQLPLPPRYIIGQITDIRAAPILSRLMKAPDAEVRQGTAYALRNMKSEVAIDALIGGLDDPDREVRYNSVMGLGENSGALDAGEWRGVAFATFEAREREYLEHWKAWAATRQSKKSH